MLLKSKSIVTIVCICATIALFAIAVALVPHGETDVQYDENTLCFDTVSRIYSYAGDSADEFEKNCDEVWELLYRYHKLLDIYNEYSGMNNLCTLNKNAGGEPVELDRELIDVLVYAKKMHTATGGRMNIMIGSLTSLWHDAREGGTAIPEQNALLEASLHTSIDLLEIDETNCTARITDPLASVDVGAIGKGYATEIAARLLEKLGATSYVLNIGGNVRCIGTKPDGSGWSIGITDPNDPSSNAAKVEISDLSCVTSGDYQRYFTVDGKRYHHIIDTDTLMPAEYFSSVTVICEDSALADTLSTALFCMSRDDGEALIASFGEELNEEIEVVWIDRSGVIYFTDGAPLK